ncbi:amidohydrolase [Polaromonas sp. P1(28)-8]|nr:amidohydrolase [Polaromonas sp. P1(28)-8]
MGDLDTSYKALRCGCGAIDTHTHVVPEKFPAYTGARKSVAWPSTEPAAHACQRNVMVNGAVYRTVTSQCWDSSARLADMDAMGVQQQVLSPMPELLSYWLETDDAQALLRFINETTAELVASQPSRFMGLAAVPLQDVGATIAEMEYATQTLGLIGVEIGSNINGVPLGSPNLLPFFRAAAAMQVPIFVHAVRPSGMDRLVGPPLLEQVLAFPGEVGLSAASLLTAGTLGQAKGLRIAFSHGGGTLPALLPRLQHGWSSLAPITKLMANAPFDAVRELYFDDLVYDVPAIKNLLRLYGEEKLMLGTDYPFPILDKDPLAKVSQLGLTDHATDLLSFRNARRWLGLAEAGT